MKYNSAILFIFLYLGNFAYAQSSTPPNIQWQKSFGGSASETAKSIVQTPDGGYISAGFSKSSDGNATMSHGNNDFWIVKMDASGNLQWQKSLGGSGDDQASSIRNTSDGGYIVAGFTDSTDGDITLNKGLSDYWIVKLNALGNIEWQKTYGGIYQDIATSVRQTADGGYVATGYTSSNTGDVTGNHGSSDYWIIKLNSTGNLQWQKALGGSSGERAFDIQQTNEGGYIIAGDTYSYNGDLTTSPLGSRDFWIVKLGNTGNILWEKRFGGSGEDNAYSIAQTTDNGYIVSGTTTSTNGNITFNNGQGDYWIIKLNATGNLQWQKTFGGPNYDQAYSITQSSDESYLAAGYISTLPGTTESPTPAASQYWLVKIDYSGNLLWQKDYGGNQYETAHSVIPTIDGGIVVAGFSNSNPNSGDVTGNHGDNDFWIIKLAENQLSTNENIIKSNISIYPNPAKDFVTIDHLPSKATISIYDMSGRKIFSKKYTETKVSMHTSQLTNGTYIIQIDDQEKTILSEKLIIKK
ncbi:T9SS type A sorting domain-containing protein [Chryseobacterium camelliae]|uniref:T9SS type A sorting domain-containing protein n=1 Tax=Chryseobacterium camelliae TaxID=1265445 RepID=A0ABY7QQM9_9FLAO|nr:T9SS type A sorting domain-containing protein [Chryseobacterium camelliae]WBV61945.1 T9SS type A sorting domain-containing protein [Chryseobacterium camelliae]